MRIQPLYDLQQEINRLFIAGSKFAQNDPRLAKQIPVLSKLGEKAPVFKKLAQDVETLCRADANESAGLLLEISTLLYSILYTQGEVTGDGERSEQHAQLDINTIDTQASYLQLKPLISALTESRQGRYNVVQDAWQEGLFKDFRLYPYVSLALGDKYAELAEYMEKTVAPSIGKPIIPFLLADFSYEGRPEDVRRLHILAAMDDEHIAPIVERVMQESPAALQAAAIAYLSKDVKNEEWLLALADDKQKVIREAAFNGLAKISTQNAWRKLTDLFKKSKKTDIDALSKAMEGSENRYFSSEIIEKLKEEFAALLPFEASAESQKVSAVFDDFTTKMRALRGDRSKEAVDFVVSVYTDKTFQKLMKKHKNVLSWRLVGIINVLGGCLYKAQNEYAGQALQNLSANPYTAEEWNTGLIDYYFLDSARTLSASEMYERFSPYYKKQQISSHLFFIAYDSHLYSENPGSGSYSSFTYSNFRDYLANADAIDSRWADLFLARISNDWGQGNDEETLYLASLIEGPGSSKMQKVLTQIMKEQAQLRANGISTSFTCLFSQLVASGAPKAFELTFDVCANLARMKQQKNSGYGFWYFANDDSITLFPREYAEKFRALYANTQDSAYLKAAEAIERKWNAF